jgi:hypothetical protein
MLVATHLDAMLSTIAIAPGLCIHIMGILSALTNFEWYVHAIWGMYWIAARIAEETPRNVAHIKTRGVRGRLVGGLVVARRKVTKSRRKLYIRNNQTKT